jgi:hypothetical protein
MNSVIGERFEHLDPFGAMIVSPVRRGLRRPANDHIQPVTLVEGVPVLCVPGIVQRLHQLHVLLLIGHITLPSLQRSGFGLTPEDRPG